METNNANNTISNVEDETVSNDEENTDPVYLENFQRHLTDLLNETVQINNRYLNR